MSLRRNAKQMESGIVDGLNGHLAKPLLGQNIGIMKNLLSSGKMG